MPKTPLFIRKNYKNSPFVKKLKSENDYSINQFESGLDPSGPSEESILSDYLAQSID